jgi:hypothetical protein
MLMSSWLSTASSTLTGSSNIDRNNQCIERTTSGILNIAGYSDVKLAIGEAAYAHRFK